MKRFITSGARWLLTSTVLAMAGAIASTASVITVARVLANNPAIISEGRHAEDASGAVRLGFPGVTLHLRLSAWALKMSARASSDDVFFDVSIDGAAPTVLRLKKGEGTYELLQKSSVAEHTLVLTRRTESWMGTCEILGFELQGGELLPRPALPARKLMFIGDSVTSGELTAWVPGCDTHEKVNSNARVSYGMILARRLGAQCHLVSYGGRGIIRDWQGIRDTRNAPQFYELALPDDPAVRWDHARYVPDAIGIQLGTNDFSPGIPEQSEFVNAYVEFIRKIQRDAPQAFIFIMDSPIVNDEPGRGPRRTLLHFYLEQVVARIGSPKVMLAPLPRYAGVPGNGHPSGAEHEAMAAELEPAFRRVLGW
jgi:hypothetical protein